MSRSLAFTQRSMISAIAATIVVLAIGGCGGGGGSAAGGSGSGRSNAPAQVAYSLHSKRLDRSLREVAVVPPDSHGRPLLIMLHGRGGYSGTWAKAPMPQPLGHLGKRAPIVIGIDGADHSYYHDRRDGDWEQSVLHEVIPDAVKRFGADPERIAIGGHFMGGFGALDIAEHNPSRFCAVGAHEPAVWRSGGETPAGAFDDADDFARNDLIGQAAGAHPFGTTRVWIDWGDRDYFVAGDTALVAAIRAGGTKVVQHTSPGTHGMAYVRRNLAAAMRFYADALQAC
jgi:S-formylglutathione hydrolase FrmB